MSWRGRSVAPVSQACGHRRPCRVHLLGMTTNVSESHLLASLLVLHTQCTIWDLSFCLCPLWGTLSRKKLCRGLLMGALSVHEPPGTCRHLQSNSFSGELGAPQQCHRSRSSVSSHYALLKAAQVQLRCKNASHYSGDLTPPRAFTVLCLHSAVPTLANSLSSIQTLIANFLPAGTFMRTSSMEV